MTSHRNGYWKYYDAIVTVRLAGQDYKFALEYERTPKAARHYVQFESASNRKDSILCFLYLVPNHDLLWFVADRFLECKRTVCFGLFKDFLEQTLTLSVRKSGSPASVSLDSILTHRKVAQRPGFSSRILPCDWGVIGVCLEYLVVRKSRSTSGLGVDYDDRTMCERKTSLDSCLRIHEEFRSVRSIAFGATGIYRFVPGSPKPAPVEVRSRPSAPVLYLAWNRIVSL